MALKIDPKQSHAIDQVQLLGIYLGNISEVIFVLQAGFVVHSSRGMNSKL